YVALSYRWGQTANITTTVENIAARRAGIPWDTIPHTIQDAITITRRLGIQYLWVDALCIIQGSLDWEVESPKMAQVYGGAFLTISAALAPDSSHGILSRTGRAVLQPLASSNYPLQNDPLYSRAWALQERFLSPRLLIFGSDQLYWECAERQVGKNGKKIGKIVSWRMPSRISSAELIHWHAIVRDYTGRLLTVEADKLPAIAGIATLLCQVTGDQYLAGMWRKQIIGDLLWRQMYVGHGHQAPLGVPLEYRAPSWSWASLD
ncbi:heterokaryon incompatibility protein-domain-containing protein, partial [Tricladium varicosporioides]